MTAYYLIARDCESFRLFIGDFADWFQAVSYVNAHNSPTWNRHYRVGSV